MRMDMKASGAALMQWHGETERDLPWKGETDAYRIWVSETMLQQTRAAAAAKRYEEFLREFPDVFALAQAEEQRVLQLWQGLGYYARARNLHKAAKQLVERHGGVFPEDEKAIRELAGIGDYTACAVLSMAYGRAVAAVDANLARVISRMFAVRGYVEDNRERLKKIGTEWLCSCAEDRPGDFNRALMGLGAMVCTAKKAECDKCPVAKWCGAYALGEQEILPEKRPKRGRKEEWHALALATDGKRMLVRQRPDKGMLAGMWEFPHYLMDEGAMGPETCAARLKEDGAEPGGAIKEGPGSEFLFTHRVWRLKAWVFRIEGWGGTGSGRMADADEIRQLPMASVMEPYRQAALEILGKEE